MNFDINLFYKVAIVVFMLVALGNTYSLYVSWDYLNLGDKVSRIASTSFNFIIVGAFYYMLKANNRPIPEEFKDNEEIIKAFEK